MAHTIYNLFHRKATPQHAPVPGSNQVANLAGGYAWQRLMRFLVLGTEGGTYYISEQSLTRKTPGCWMWWVSRPAPRLPSPTLWLAAWARA